VYNLFSPFLYKTDYLIRLLIFDLRFGAQCLSKGKIKFIIMGNLIWFIIVLLIIGWLIGFVAFPAVGGIIHLLLVIAVIMIIIRLLTGRRV